jgi:hypothetical protein
MAAVLDRALPLSDEKREDSRLLPGALDTLKPRARSITPDTALVVSVGVLLVALAYARSREGLSYAAPLLWAGQLLIFVFVVVCILHKSTSARDRAFLAIVFAAAQAVIRWAYSPHAFTFSDELQHLRSLENVLTTHHLFHPNHSLPISPQYPGLENVTAELAQVSSASPFVAGVLIASICHVLMATSLVLLFREVTASSRVACLGVVLYMLNPHAAYFDTSFLYETLALPFLVLAVLLAIRFASRRSGRVLSFAGVVVCSAMVTITHHVSILATVAVIAGIAVVTALFPASRSLAPRLAMCAVAGVAVFWFWIHFFAPATLDYLSSPGDQILTALAKLGEFDGKLSLPHPPTPLFDRATSPLGVLVTLGLLAVSVRLARGRQPLERSFIAAAAGSYVLVIATRLLVENGPELSARILTFTTMFTAVAMAIALEHLVFTARGRHGRPVRTASRTVVATSLTIVLFLASVVTSLPEWWQRLPGKFWIDGFASGIDTVGTSRAEWAATHLSPNARFFGDIASLTLLATRAELDPIRDPGSLYYTDRLTPENLALIRSESAVYLDVDLRMTEQTPITGNYFAADINKGYERKPIDPVFLLKFDKFGGISRIYDSGYDRFYDLRWVQA